MSKRVIFKDFNYFAAGLLTVTINATNPDQAGTTGQFSLATYNSDGDLID